MIGSSTRRELLTGLSLVCFALPVANADPQYSRDAWDISRGYPGGQIYGLTQTSDGYLWMGTDRGLIRFDGSRFQEFRQVGPAGTSIDSVFALAGDRHGNLLISTLLGLQRLRLRNEELEELPRLPGQPHDPLVGIYHDRQGTILIANVRKGIVTYDGRSFVTIEGTRPDITSAVQAPDGTLWMGTATQGLFVHPRRPSLRQSAELNHVKINALLPFGERGLIVGTSKGLLQLDGAAPPGRLFGPPDIRALLEDRQGNVWLGSTEGLYQLRVERGAVSTSRYSRDAVTSLYEDREGDVWAGTSTGIVRFRERILTTYVLDSAGGSSGPLFADSRGALWCARSKFGAVRIVDGRVEPIPGLPGYGAVTGLGPDLWLGRKDGALLRATRSGDTMSTEAHVGHPIISILKSREGPLWVGMQNAGVAEIVNGQPTFYSSVDGLVLNTVTAIEHSRGDVLWFATANGIASRSRGSWQSYAARNGVPPGRIHCLFADKDDVVWIGADQGLAFIRNGRVHALPANLRSLREPIFGIAADRDDYLWILTSSHVSRVKRADLLMGVADSVFVRQFGVDDGLPAVSPNRSSRSITTDDRGRVWMSLGNTVVMADPSGLRQPSPPTLVQFQQISADDLSLRLGETVSIPAGHVRTVIRFAGLNLAAPERVRFRYKLEGLDPDWSEASSAHEATYTNLEPGPYRFSVQASTIDGLWNGPSATVALHQEPAWWQTVWFRACAALAIGAMGFMAYQLQLRSLKRQWNVRFQERLDERTRIARDLHDTLLQSFHGLILRFQAARNMLPEEPDAANDALGSAIAQAAAAIIEGRDAVQALRGEEEFDDLAESLAGVDRELRDEAETETSYRVLVEGTPRRLHPVVRDDLYRIAREAIRNAFRHARAKEIELDIWYDDEALRLRVRDDGGGIDPLVMHSGRRKGHYGLPGMRERAISIGGQFEIWSELRRGTEIEITIPGVIAYVRFKEAANGVLS